MCLFLIWASRLPQCVYVAVNLNPFMSVAPKLPDYFGDIFLTKTIFKKLIEGEILIKIQPTALLQIVCEFMINSNVFKSIFGPDNSCQGVIQTCYRLNHPYCEQPKKV